MNTRLQTRRAARPAALLTATLALGGLAQAQLSGNVFDGSGGPLGPGVVTFSSFTVPAGETLTVLPGTILKANASSLITVDGSLLTTADVVFTSIADDANGGDTDGGGSSVGAPGDWAGIRANAGGLVRLTDTELAYAGASIWSTAYASGGRFELDGCLVRDCENSGANATGTLGALAITNTHFQSCERWPVENLELEDLADFTGNTSAGAGFGDAIEVDVSTLTTDLDVQTHQVINDTLLFPGSWGVDDGVRLSFGPGMVLKQGSTNLVTIDGELSLAGSALAPVVFTSSDDDAHGADLTPGVLTDGAPGDWSGLRTLGANALLDVSHGLLRYHGASIWSGVYQSGGVVQVADSVIELGDGNGIDALGADLPLTVERTHFAQNNDYPINRLDFEQVPDLRDNTAAGNGRGDVLRVADGSIDRDTAVELHNLIGSSLLTSGSFSIDAGARWHLGEGLAVKVTNSSLVSIDGELVVRGTGDARTTFTHVSDDAVGGDTTNDGLTQGVEGDWAGLRVLATGSLDAEFMDVRFAGASIWTSVYLDGGDLRLIRCRLLFADGDGIDFNGQLTPVVVEACRIENNTGYAARDIPIAILPGLDSNLASGNALGDYARSVTATLTADTVVRTRNLLNSTLVIPGSTSIPDGLTLELREGVRVKFTNSSLWTVGGSLVTRGEPDNHVFVTHLDDDVGVDSNGDGPSESIAGSWAGIRTLAGSLLDVEHMTVRNGGAGIWSNFVIAGDGHRLNAVRSERCSDDGFQFDGAVPAVVQNCVAFGNASNGFELNSSTVQLNHVTSVGNGFGVQSDQFSALGLVNSIAWGNGADLDLNGAFAVTASTASNPPAGIGNSNQNPLFVDQFGGDLRLDLGSPAVNAGQPATGIAVGRDATDAPRILLGLSTPLSLPDHGAYEQADTRLTVDGIPAIGRDMTFGVAAEPSLTGVYFSLVPDNQYIDPFGNLLIGADPLTFFASIPAGGTFVETIPPNPSLPGISVFFQGFNLPFADPTRAELTNVVDFEIEAALP